MNSLSNIISRNRQIGKTTLIMQFDKIREQRDKKMESAGWTVECWSPLEIRHSDGSFASGQAAQCVIHDVCYVPETEEEILSTLVENGFPDGHESQGDPSTKLYFLGVADKMYDDLVYVRKMSVDCFGLIAKLAKIRCLKKAPKETPQIQWPTGNTQEELDEQFKEFQNMLDKDREDMGLPPLKRKK